jgi:hypothetical protein
MSSLRNANGDDYPDAAGKHLADAEALVAARRYDGAGYLAGYVVECALKSLLQVETGGAQQTHSYAKLLDQVGKTCLTAGAMTAKYVTETIRGIPNAAIAGWKETMRYRSPSMGSGDAHAWIDDATVVYTDTIASMILDGVIQ